MASGVGETFGSKWAGEEKDTQVRNGGWLTDTDVEPHRDARVLMEREGDSQVDPSHALSSIEVTPECFSRAFPSCHRNAWFQFFW